MQSTKPYLIRAIHEWCVDQGLTPYISVAVDVTTRVPREFVKNNEIVLNVGLEATSQLHLGNEEITFQGRFGGKVFPVVVPVARIAAIYARENSEGMAFEISTETIPAEIPADVSSQTEAAAGADNAAAAPPARPVLTRVK
ncbi:MAG: ClpXP protease specificity-enhancing factor [Rugosibacter sp.]|nr:ClpXP protease specificity-enhancing factor [Rugosibacter sp.]